MTVLPFELHPDIPPQGVTRKQRGGARYESAVPTYARVEEACAEAGLPFRRPVRIPNTRLALETAELVRRYQPEVFETLDRLLYEAHFVRGLFLGDPAVVTELLDMAGGETERTMAAVRSGAARPALLQARERALEAGVAGTPAWLLDGRLLVPGLQPREFFVRTVDRLRVRRPEG